MTDNDPEISSTFQEGSTSGSDTLVVVAFMFGTCGSLIKGVVESSGGVHSMFLIGRIFRCGGVACHGIFAMKAARRVHAVHLSADAASQLCHLVVYVSVIMITSSLVGRTAVAFYAGYTFFDVTQLASLCPPLASTVCFCVDSASLRQGMAWERGKTFSKWGHDPC